MVCEVSRLTIPADRRYAEIAARYVPAAARLIGFASELAAYVAACNPST